MSEITNNAEHTPTPWTYDGYYIVSPVNGDVAQTLRNRPNGHVDAAHIVKCVNAHDELVAALKAFTKAEESFREATQHQSVDDWLDDAYEQAIAILAKVKA